MIQTLKIISTGTITGLKIGAGVGMGVVFGSGILSVYRNLGHPKERPQFFNYALLGFTYTEAYAAGLFALICLFILVYFSILFVFACLLSTDQFILTLADTSIQFIPFIQYSNADTQKAAIIMENRKKSGIYIWINNKNQKIYVGSAINLTKRFYMYCSIKHLAGAKSSLICKALRKYGHSCFSFGILEYCDKNDIINREQYYIDTLSPEYNISRVAGSPLGVIRSKETKAKIAAARSGRNHS
jgi:hypothetical protein